MDGERGDSREGEGGEVCVQYSTWTLLSGVFSKAVSLLWTTEANIFSLHSNPDRRGLDKGCRRVGGAYSLRVFWDR